MLFFLIADIDECTMTCFESENQICNNTIGSYDCFCMDGYQENETGQGCEGLYQMGGNFIPQIFLSRVNDYIIIVPIPNFTTCHG